MSSTLACMTGPAEITVVTWNAQGSRGLDEAAVAAALGAFEPDLVLLQEVQRTQLGALRAAMGMTDARWRFKHWAITVPAEGLGLLSVQPFDRVRSKVLAHAWQFWNWRRRIAIHFDLPVGESVGLPASRPAVLRGVNVHLGAGVTHDERTRQARTLLGSAPGAHLIAGDLNAEPESSELACFAEHGFSDAERGLHGDRPRPSTNWKPGPRTDPPTQRLDYLLIRSDLEATEAFVPVDWQAWAPLSDHLPVIARLRVHV